MSTQVEAPKEPDGFEKGFSVEHILLSVTVVHTNRIMQYDDSAARILEKELLTYNGIKSVNAKAQYDHGKTDIHANGCECGKCTFQNEPR